MRQQNGLLKIRVVKLLTGPAFGSRESFSHCMHGVDVDCQGRFFGPGVVHRCSRHLCILFLFLEANPSFSHLSVVFTLLRHLCMYINTCVPTCRETLWLSRPGDGHVGTLSVSLPLWWVLIQSDPLKPDFDFSRTRLTAWMITAPTKRMGKAVVFWFFLFFLSLWPPGPPCTCWGGPAAPVLDHQPAVRWAAEDLS